MECSRCIVTVNEKDLLLAPFRKEYWSPDADCTLQLYEPESVVRRPQMESMETVNMLPSVAVSVVVLMNTMGSAPDTIVLPPLLQLIVGSGHPNPMQDMVCKSCMYPVASLGAATSTAPTYVVIKSSYKKQLEIYTRWKLFQQFKLASSYFQLCWTQECMSTKRSASCRKSKRVASVAKNPQRLKTEERAFPLAPTACTVLGALLVNVAYSLFITASRVNFVCTMFILKNILGGCCVGGNATSYIMYYTRH